MTNNTQRQTERDTVVIVGGKGSLLSRYRDAVEKCGFRLRSYEERSPGKGAPSAAKIAVVIVMASMVSHPLMSQARALAGDQARIVYLRSPSVTAVRQTVQSVWESERVHPALVL